MIKKSSIQQTIWKYYAFHFFRDSMFLSAVLVPFFTEWGNISLFQVQLLQSWFMLWIFLLEVPTGAVADYFGRKYSLALGALIGAVGAILYGSIPQFEIFLLAEFFFAAAMALTSGADQALLYDALKEAGQEGKSKDIFGKAHAVKLLGIMISALIGSGIAATFGLNAPMLFTAIPMFLACIIALTLQEPKKQEVVSESARYLDIISRGFLFFSHHRELRIMALDAILIASAGYFVIWLYQPLLQQLAVPIVYFGVGHFLFSASEIIIAGNFVKLERFFGGGKKFFQYTSLIVFLPFILAAIFPNIGSVTLFILLAGGFGMTRLDLMGSYMNRYIPSGERATILSSISMFRRFATVILNPMVGLLANQSLSVALLAVSLLPLAVFFFSPLEQEMLEESL